VSNSIKVHDLHEREVVALVTQVDSLFL